MSSNPDSSGRLPAFRAAVAGQPAGRLITHDVQPAQPPTYALDDPSIHVDSSACVESESDRAAASEADRSSSEGRGGKVRVLSEMMRRGQGSRAALDVGRLPAFLSRDCRCRGLARMTSREPRRRPTGPVGCLCPRLRPCSA